MIAVQNLVKRHDGRAVLDGVSLTVQPGEVAVVLGPSGGGKSTLLRCVNGLERFDAGTVTVGDAALTRQSTGPELQRLRRRVGMVFQQFHLFPHLSVLENVALGPLRVLEQPRDQAETTARRLLDRVGLADRATARPEQLSGGQQQRVAIARALAVQPQAMLFDEPTSALDPRMAGEVQAVIADLAKGRLTMLVVTHALGFARAVAKTVHVMHAGKVAESGPPGQIFDAPREDVTRDFIAQASH